MTTLSFTPGQKKSCTVGLCLCRIPFLATWLHVVLARLGQIWARALTLTWISSHSSRSGSICSAASDVVKACFCFVPGHMHLDVPISSQLKDVLQHGGSKASQGQAISLRGFRSTAVALVHPGFRNAAAS